MPKCPKCQADVPPQAKFCSSCGANVPAAAPKPTPPQPKKPAATQQAPAKDQPAQTAAGPKPPKSKILFYVISFFVGLFGIICGIIYLFKPSKECKKFGRNCLLWGLIPSLVMIIILSVIS